MQTTSFLGGRGGVWGGGGGDGSCILTSVLHKCSLQPFLLQIMAPDHAGKYKRVDWGGGGDNKRGMNAE